MAVYSIDRAHNLLNKVAYLTEFVQEIDYSRRGYGLCFIRVPRCGLYSNIPTVL